MEAADATRTATRAHLPLTGPYHGITVESTDGTRAVGQPWHGQGKDAASTSFQHGRSPTGGSVIPCAVPHADPQSGRSFVYRSNSSSKLTFKLPMTIFNV